MKKLYTILILFFIFCNFLNAGEKTEKDVENFMKKITADFKDLTKKQINEEERKKEFRELIDNIVDSKWIARFILGQYWRELTEEQQVEFENTYREFLLNNYLPKMNNFDKDLNITNIEKQRDKVFMVSSKIKDSKNVDVNIAFRIIERNNNLYITDIIPEGISFLGSQRTDIGTAISQNGYDNFIKDLKSKIKNNN